MLDIIVCDDHPVVRQGLTRIILANLHASVREADHGQALLDMVRQKPGDCVLLDVGLPGRSGLDVLRQLKHERPRLPVLMVSVHPAAQYGVRAIRAGASGYLTKDLAVDELVKAVTSVADGHRYVTREVAEQLAAGVAQPEDRPPHESLSDREFEVLCMLGAGKKVREIATDLCLSYNTISTYRARVLTKLNLKSDSDLIRYALHHGLAE
jgi:two-component system invasion response regulator UvrY